MIGVLTGAPGGLAKICEFFAEKAKEGIEKQSWTTVGGTGKNVDLVRDVLRLLPVYWVCEVVCTLVRCP